MRTTLTDFEIESYRLNGFIAIHDFLDDEELATLRRVVDRVAAPTPSDTGLSNFRGRDRSDAEPELAAFWRAPEVGKAIAALEGLTSVRHMGDSISFVMQGHGATPWHCGMMESLPLDSRQAVTLYVPLDDFRWYNKALNFLPGTHKTAPLGVRMVSPSLRNATFGSIFDDVPEWRNIEPVVCEGRAGMGIFYNLAGVHGSAPNMTPRTRRFAGATYIKDGEVWNGCGGEADANGVTTFRGLKEGEPFGNEQAPVIWSR